MKRIVQPATLCYVRRGRHTLMLHRTRRAGDVHRGKWNGLGGKFNPGETPDECVRREVWEESGLRVTQLKWRGVLSFPLFTPGMDWLVFVFTATARTQAVRETDEGRLEWIPTRRLLHLSLWPGDRIFLKWLNGRRFFSGRFEYRNKKLVRHSVHFYP